MAAGLRIHHPDPQTWGATVLVPHPGDPRTGRNPKDYHLRLDTDGNTIVSATVWQRLLEARASGLSPHPFLVLNEVPEPPTQRIGATGSEERRRMLRQEAAALRELAPPGTRPRVTRPSTGDPHG